MMHDPNLSDWIRDTFARRDETMTREEFAKYVLAIEEAHRAEDDRMAARLKELEDWKSNLTGRAIAITAIGAVLIAVSSAVITRLIFPTTLIVVFTFVLVLTAAIG